MGGKVSRSDYEWVYTQQPHIARRKMILDKYPEIKKLMGPDTSLTYVALAMVIFQIISCYYISQLSIWWILLFAYFLGGTINHCLMMIIHECSHNLIFGHYYPLANKLFSMWANLPIGIPVAATFKKYHMEHHKFLGEDGTDTDIAPRFEAFFFTNTPLKIMWMLLHPLFYCLRPGIIKPMTPTPLEVVNCAIQLTFDALMVYFCGYKSLVYFIGGTILGMGLHPVAGHFISEHYMFNRGYETYSYYGILNKISFNAGYHVEHHDFPYIPGSRLPEVKRIAGEFYDSLPRHTSWVKVIWDFITMDNMGPFARVCRDPDHFNKDMKQNPFYNTPHPSVEPSKNREYMGYRVEGPEVDWNTSDGSTTSCKED